MAEWLTSEVVYVGDAVGNPLQMRVGVVKVNKRTTVGCQADPGNPGDRPDYTMDVAALTDMIKELSRQRSVLIRTTGGFG